MSIHKIHLKKLLTLFYLPEGKLNSKLREDVSNHIQKELGNQSSGQDFHMPFWRDVKDHLEGSADLTEQTEARVQAHHHKKRLYPLLKEKFLEWWNEKKRWTNEGFSVLPDGPKGQHEIAGLGIIKIENILPLNIGSQPTRYFYPYFSEKPILNEEAARIGLWIMQQALPNIPADRLRILDILRAKSFSLKKNPLQGNEEELLKYNYRKIIRRWDEIYEEKK